MTEELSSQDNNNKLLSSNEFISQEKFKSPEHLDSLKKESELKNAEEKLALAVTTYKKLFWAICIYVVLVLVMLSFNKYYIGLTDPILIALLTTTTTNILGVFYIASKWLYAVEGRIKKIEIN